MIGTHSSFALLCASKIPFIWCTNQKTRDLTRIPYLKVKPTKENISLGQAKLEPTTKTLIQVPTLPISTIQRSTTD